MVNMRWPSGGGACRIDRCRRTPCFRPHLLSALPRTRNDRSLRGMTPGSPVAAEFDLVMRRSAVEKLLQRSWQPEAEQMSLLPARPARHRNRP